MQNIWEKVYIDGTSDTSYWTFKENVVIKEHRRVGLLLIVDTAGYVLEKKNYKYFLTIVGFGKWEDGTYLILDIDEDMLVIERIWSSEFNAPYYYWEFIRKY